MADLYIDSDLGSPFNNGSIGTPLASLILAAATVTGYIGNSSDGGNTITSPSNVLTITGVSAGAASKGRRITGSGVTANTAVTSNGTSNGLAGEYAVDKAQSVALTTFTIDNPNFFGGANRYFLKAGTTHDLSAFPAGYSPSSLASVLSYGSGLNPLIFSTTGTCLSGANRNGWDIKGIDCLSLGGTRAADGFNHSASTWTDCNIVGRNCGFLHQVTASAANLLFTRCSFRHTLNTGVSSGFFSNVTVAGAVFKGFVFDDCDFNDCAGNGMQFKSGDGVASGYHDGITITNCRFKRNAIFGLGVFTGDLIGLTPAQWARNVSIKGSEFMDNLGPGCAGVAAGGGYFAGNIVSGNCFGAITGTGGCQFSGTGWMVEWNAVWQNGAGNAANGGAGFGADGAGIYLDQIAGFSANGCRQSVVRRNIVWGHKGYFNSSNVSGNISSAGIKAYRSGNNEIHSNICYDNYVGICIDNWSPNNKVYNNDCLSNTQIGIATGWNIGPTNPAQNNLITGSPVDISAPVAGDIVTTGNLTLTATGAPKAETGTSAVVTATSSAADFAGGGTPGWSGYAIRETAGPGWGFIHKPKTNDNVVVIAVVVPFSTTAFANGAWKLTYGTAQTGINDSNMAFNPSRANGGVGAPQVLVNLTPGANDVLAVDPALDELYNVTAASLKASGKWIGSILDYYGKEFQSPPSIGAVQYPGTRTTTQIANEGVRNVAELV